MEENEMQDQEALAVQWEAQLGAEAAQVQAQTPQEKPPAQENEASASTGRQNPVEARPAAFQPVQDPGQGGTPRNLEFLLDIPLEVTVQLGTTRMPIRELLQLSQGSVVELDKLAGEPLDVLINHRLIGRGEVVVVNEKFGVRLTEVLSPTERIQRLQNE